MELQVQEFANAVQLTINVKTSRQENRLIIAPDGTITVHVKAPPVDGKANNEIVRWLAKTLGRRTSQVRIVRGLRSNIKMIEIANMTRAEFSRIINDAVQVQRFN